MIAAKNRHCCVILEMNILLSTSQEIQCRTVQVLLYDFNNKGILKYFEKVILDNLVWGSWRLINREAAYEKCKLFQTRLSSIAIFFSRRINQWECSIHIKLNYLVLSVTFKKMWIKLWRPLLLLVEIEKPPSVPSSIIFYHIMLYRVQFVLYVFTTLLKHNNVNKIES
jgi:hypothetical protein